MEEQSKELQDYLLTLKKRKTGILLIAISIMVVSAMIAYLLPPVYRSSSTILIEQQEIPQEMVMSTVTSYAAERIQVIQARVMSRANLMEIIEKYDLYKNERKSETTEQILARVTEDISLNVINAEVVDPRTGRPSSATIAFSLAFEGESPAQVQRVANELTSLYLNENLKSRTQKAEDTSVFFNQENTRISNLILKLETKMADFKQKNADMLPEKQAINSSLLLRKEAELASLEIKMTTLEDRRFYLNGQLSQIDPGNPSVMNAGTRLKVLESEYIAMRSRYSAEHPDVISIKDQIASLKQKASSDKSGMIAESLAAMRVEYASAKKRYSADHPDVIALEKKIAGLEKDLASQQKTPDETYFESNPDNPAYITLKAQLATIESELTATAEQKKNLYKDIEQLQTALQRAPHIEREYRSLQRENENALSEYRANKAKQVRADVAKQLESEKKGERFSLIDPPALPEQPISPNRPAIMFLGIVLALGGGIGFAFVSDAVSGAVRGARNIQNVLGVYPLAVIPYQMNMTDMSRRKKIRKRTILVGIVIFCLSLLLIHLFMSPLDVLWFRILRRIDVLLA